MRARPLSPGLAARALLVCAGLAGAGFACAAPAPPAQETSAPAQEAGAPAQEAPKTSTPSAQASPPEVEASPEPQTHPGSVLMVKPDGTERVEPADRLPESIAWYTDARGQRVAVTRVVMTDGPLREVKRYGADGRLLDVTTAPPPPPPRP